jgi:hypothetical protein
MPWKTFIKAHLGAIAAMDFLYPVHGPRSFLVVMPLAD